MRTPVEAYVKNADWKRDPDGRVNVESLKKLATFMLEQAAVAGEAGERRPDGRPELPAEVKTISMVIPAKAGIQCCPSEARERPLEASLVGEQPIHAVPGKGGQPAPQDR